MKQLLTPLALLLAGCVPVNVSSVAYTTACPEGDFQCETRHNASTLYYMGQIEASTALMCGIDPEVRYSLNSQDNLCALY
jgi:hypothetical protein